MIRLGWYGDDFTGATDTLATVARAGLRAMLFLGVPDAQHLDAAGPLDAVGIAGAARGMTPAGMDAELEPVGCFFDAVGPAVLHYKCCSTFDSTPHIGSIGAAVHCLRCFVRNRFIPIVGGQPSIGRYCAFSNLFAAAGTGGLVSRIDRHPTMAEHPVTPMAEADLRLHLQAQGLDDIAGIHFPTYEHGIEQLNGEIAGLLAKDVSAVLLDLTREAELPLLGELIWRQAEQQSLLAVGPSSVAQALVAHWGLAPAPPAPLAPAEGPVFAMIGSLSPVSRAQVAASPSFAHIEVDFLTGTETAIDLVVALLRTGRSVMVRTATVGRSEPAKVARATAQFVRQVTEAARPARIGIAGGDTSSQAALALGGWGLSYVSSLGPGVTLCRMHSKTPGIDGTLLMLKGGQMGSPDLFERLLHGREV